MSSPIPSAVLDTNTVLDWLVFGDPAALALAREIEAGRITWVASPAMRVEFDQVLPRDALTRWQPDAALAAAAWARLARLEPTEPPPGALNCRDPDDQVFIDLALQRCCTWLVTRDRALLTLARRAAAWGVTVLTPQAWLARSAVLVPTDLVEARPGRA
jgi:predicted nucleic acid-binding protein